MSAMKIEAIEIQNAAGAQSILLPDHFRIDDDKVYLKKNGGVIYIIPFHNPWQSVYDSIDEFSPDFMNERSELHNEKRELFD